MNAGMILQETKKGLFMGYWFVVYVVLSEIHYLFPIKWPLLSMEACLLQGVS